MIDNHQVRFNDKFNINFSTPPQKITTPKTKNPNYLRKLFR